MAKSSPYCPSGAVSFCHAFGPTFWFGFKHFLKTEEARDDYAKFRCSVMNTYASLIQSVARDNEVLLGWYCRDEPKSLEKYNEAADVLSSSLVKYNTDLYQLLLSRKVQGLTFEARNHVRNYIFHLQSMEVCHRHFAFRKRLAKCDFIMWDSDFNEVFRRLKSEKQWARLPDGVIRLALGQHFALLRKLNDGLSMAGFGSVNNMPEGEKLLEAINNEYSYELSVLINDFKKRRREFFSDHAERKALQLKRFDEAVSSRTVIIPKHCHLTSPKLSSRIRRALFHKNRALEKFLELQGQWGRRLGGGLRSKLLPAGVLFAGFYWWKWNEKRNIKK